MKYTEAILSDSIGKLLRFEITKCWLQFKNEFIVLFVIIFGTLSFPIAYSFDTIRARVTLSLHSA